jgi:putative lipoic acid-binding regulatory protein
VSDEQSPPPATDPSGKELLQFPTDYPIKVVGRPSAEFRARIHAVVLKHVPNVETDRITERLSENGNFLSISYMIVAESREQVVALAKDLAAAEGVLMVI